VYSREIEIGFVTSRVCRVFAALKPLKTKVLLDRFQTPHFDGIYFHERRSVFTDLHEIIRERHQFEKA